MLLKLDVIYFLKCLHDRQLCHIVLLPFDFRQLQELL